LTSITKSDKHILVFISESLVVNLSDSPEVFLQEKITIRSIYIAQHYSLL